MRMYNKKEDKGSKRQWIQKRGQGNSWMEWKESAMLTAIQSVLKKNGKIGEGRELLEV